MIPSHVELTSAAITWSNHSWLYQFLTPVWRDVTSFHWSTALLRSHHSLLSRFTLIGPLTNTLTILHILSYYIGLREKGWRSVLVCLQEVCQRQSALKFNLQEMMKPPVISLIVTEEINSWRAGRSSAVKIDELPPQSWRKETKAALVCAILRAEVTRLILTVNLS